MSQRRCTSTLGGTGCRTGEREAHCQTGRPREQNTQSKAAALKPSRRALPSHSGPSGRHFAASPGLRAAAVLAHGSHTHSGGYWPTAGSAACRSGRRRSPVRLLAVLRPLTRHGSAPGPPRLAGAQQPSVAPLLGQPRCISRLEAPASGGDLRKIRSTSRVSRTEGARKSNRPGTIPTAQ